jgi:dihydrofolate reductase
MTDSSNRILQVVNRTTSEDLTVGFTREIHKNLDAVAQNWSEKEGIKVTKEAVVVAGVEIYLETLQREELKKLKKTKGKTVSNKKAAANANVQTNTKAEEQSATVKQDNMFNTENADS